MFQKRQKANKPKDAVSITQDLKEDVKKFEARRGFLDKKAKNELLKAKALNKQGEKGNALLHLKKKKLYDAEIKKLDSGILTLEEQIIGLESGAVTKSLLDAQTKAKNALAKMMKGINIDRLDALQGEIVDQQADLEELNLMLTENGLQDMDDDELLEELEQFDLDEFENDLVDGLPTTPTELRELEGLNDEKELEEAELLKELLDDAPTGQVAVAKKEQKKLVAVGAYDEDGEMAELEGLLD